MYYTIDIIICPCPFVNRNRQKKQNRTLYAGSVFDFRQTFTLQPNLSGILPVWTPVMKS